ncbi:MAG: TonB family protein [Rhizobiales bacterium]|nr:TonB family protein [Hyphomicrobiales bacterium]
MRQTRAARWPETARWSVCFTLALSFHAAGAAALLARWNDGADLLANAPVIMLELAPVPVAPVTTPNELPPGPQQAEARPEPQPVKPVEKIELTQTPQAELPVTLPKPIEKPKDKTPKQKHASLASAPYGVAQLAFSIDRGGGVHNARIAHSSGSSVLDRETLALLERAQPLPPPPAEIQGGQIAVVVPIRYNFK